MLQLPLGTRHKNNKVVVLLVSRSRKGVASDNKLIKFNLKQTVAFHQPFCWPTTSTHTLSLSLSLSPSPLSLSCEL